MPARNKHILKVIKRALFNQNQIRPAKVGKMCAFLIVGIMTSLASLPLVTAGQNPKIQWEQLKPIRDREGFAGSFAGVHNGVLLVAGGANFPDKRPWQGGTKTWYDCIFVLERPNAQWRNGFKLPRPLGYGVSVSHQSGVICIGGSDAQQHHGEVFSLSWTNGEIHMQTLPSLPQPCANMCGALLGNTIYVAGGLENPNATNCLRTFWALDLAKPEERWKVLEPWPGGERMLSTAAVQDGSFFLFGGAALKKNPDNKLVREWLSDGYRFTPGKGWKRVADLPHPVVAAPSPAPAAGRNSILVLGGDDGQQVNVGPEQHKGFPRETLVYHLDSDTWSTRENMPFGLVTTPCTQWNGKIIVPGGEQRPGVRSTEVWAGSIQE